MAGGLGNVLTDFLAFINAGADTVRVLELQTTGANGATTKVFVGNRTPIGNVTASPGQFYIRVSGASSSLFVHTGAGADNTSWTALGGDFLPRDGSLAMLAALNFGGFKGTNLADPTAAQDAATKAYVDAAAAGARDPKDAVRVATAAALPAYTRLGNVLTASANGALTVDGVAVVVGDRVLVNNTGTATGADRGLYSVTDAGSGGTPWVLTRSTDADTSAKVTNGLFTYATEGTVNARSGWLLTTADPIVLNTTSLSFTQVSGLGDITAGAGLTKTGNTLDVVAAAGGSLTVNADSIQRAALTGDVTAPADSNATTIANDAVTNAKLANMATQTFKGRTTAGTGDPEDLTIAQARAMLQISTRLFTGGASFAGGDAGKHHTADGSVSDNTGRAAALDQTNQQLAPFPGTFSRLTWNTATADATTVYKVVKNGAVVETVALTGASGSAALTTTYAQNDKIAVEYDSGTAPGQSNVQVWGYQS